MRQVQKPLRRIPIPPESYKEFKAITHGLYDEDLTESVRRFFRDHKEWRGEIKKYVSKLMDVRNHNYANSLVRNDKPLIGEGLVPIEAIEVVGKDKKKTGNIQPMLIIDFDYEYQGDRIKERRVYLPLRKDWWLLDWKIPGWLATSMEKAEMLKNKKDKRLLPYKP